MRTLVQPDLIVEHRTLIELLATEAQAASAARSLRSLLRALLAASAEGLAAWLTVHSLDEGAVRWLEMHRLAPFVFHSLRAADLLARVPSPAQELLRAAYYASAGHNAVLTAELNTLLTDFRQVSVDPIVLKGMALGVTLYPVPGARPISDLDLLVERGQMEAVRQVLAGRGYRDLGLDPEHHLAFGSHLHARRELAAGRQVAVEVHWNLVHDPGCARHIDLADMHCRAWQADFGGFSARVLDPADQLIHAAAHLLQHGHAWNLLWLLDLRLWVDRYGAAWDWRGLVARAGEMRLAGVLGYWLELAEAWLGPCLPPAARDALAEVELHEEESRRLRVVRGRPLRVGELLWLRARGAGDWRARLTYLAETLFPPWRYMQQRYRPASRWLGPLCYGWRVVRAVVAVFRRADSA
jgi:hypothetical protein